MSGSSPLDRLEVVGDGANIVVDNGVHVTYYRRAGRGAYGRSRSYQVPTDLAPLQSEPEFSVRQLYNKNILLLDCVAEIGHLRESIPSKAAPSRGTLEASLENLKIFRALCANLPEEMITVG